MPQLTPLERRIWMGGFLLFVATAVFNLGFVALDEYQHGIVQYLPAQESTLHRVVTESYIRSPLQVMPLFGLAQLALAVGIEAPFAQFRVVLVALALFAYFSLTAATLAIFPRERGSWRAAGLAAVAFHFMSSFVFTRPMFESMAAPWILGAVAWLCAYERRPAARHLALSLGCLTVACIFRPQAGACVIVYPIVIALGRRWMDLLWLTFIGLLCFAGSGLPDLFLRSGFHESLRNYVGYNLANSHLYGAQPFYNYFLLLLGLGFVPILLTGTRGFDWRGYGRAMRVPLLAFAIFLAAHSLVSHKEERFMIPILPTMLACLAPFLAWHFGRGGWRNSRVRLTLALNALLLVPASFNTAQRNVLQLAAYLDSSEGRRFGSVVGVEDSMVLYPAAFIRAPKPKLEKLSSAEFAALRPDCNQAYVIRQDYLNGLGSVPTGLEALRSFSPGFLEAALVSLNPKHNGRRGSLTLFACGSRSIDQ